MERDIICNGELEIFPLTENLHDEVIVFYKENFLRNENVSKALNLAGSPLSLGEVEAAVRYILQDNIGYVVRHCETKEMVAMCVNKMLDPSTDLTQGYQFQSPGCIRAVEFMHQIKGPYDMFKEWNIDCVMEIVFLSTREDFGGRGLASILSERSIEFARQMLHGIFPHKDSLPEHVRDLRPKAVCSVFTSLFTQKMGEKLGFEVFVKIPFSELFYEGKSFAERIDPIHKVVTYTGMKL